MDGCSPAWPFLSSHAGAFVRLQKMLTEKRGFMLCFLTFSDSAYRNKVAEFLADQLHAHTHVAIEETPPTGTEELFIRLDAGSPHEPAQLSGLERWPQGLDDLLSRLNLRREALAERCQRPLLFWTLSTQVNAVATGAADLWAWRSGVFHFSLPKGPLPTQTLNHSSVFSLCPAEGAKRRKRIGELLDYLAARPAMLAHDVELLLEVGGLQLSLGAVDEAEDAYRRAQHACWKIGDARQRALVECGIADVLEARDQLGEALNLRQEQMPVFKRTGDIRAMAVTQGKIADVLRVRGQFADALHLLVDEVVPIYERLGDMLSKAIALGGVADIHYAAGRLNEALCIHTHERLPVFKKLGERRLQALAYGKIADVLQALGQFDEALRVRTNEEIAIYEQLGNVHASTIAQSKIGDIHHARGELDEALRIRTKVQLPAFEHLGDRRSVATTQGQAARILQARGQYDAALRLCREVELPIYDQLGDLHSKAIAFGRIADILQDQGRLDEALRQRNDDELSLYEQLGDVRAKATTQGKIADILDQLGRRQEALRLRTQAEFPIDEAYGAPDGVAPEYVSYERGGILFESRLADRVAGTYKIRPLDPHDVIEP